jgi:rhodanese-related sulfurtransferase
MKPVLPFALALAFGCGLTACADDSSAHEAAPQSVAQGTGSIRDIGVAEVDGLLSQEEGAVVLDVRTPQEFEAGHIDGAVNVDFLSDDFAEVIAELDRDTTYILHCKSGSRSTKALEVMQEQGFISVAHLTAGYDGWKAAQEAD